MAAGVYPSTSDQVISMAAVARALMDMEAGRAERWHLTGANMLVTAVHSVGANVSVQLQELGQQGREALALLREEAANRQSWRPFSAANVEARIAAITEVANTLPADVEVRIDRYLAMLQAELSILTIQSLRETKFLPFLENYVRPRRASDNEVEGEPIPPGSMNAELEKYLRIALIGDPGSGKSTSIHDVGLEAATRASTDRRQPVPLTVTLREYWRHGRSQEILEYAAEHCRTQYPESISLATIKYLAHSGRLILLLDGLDEVLVNRIVSCWRLESPTL